MSSKCNELEMDLTDEEKGKMKVQTIENNIKAHMAAILDQIYGTNWHKDENLKDTPERYARMMTELTQGLNEPEFKFTGFQKEKYQDIVSLRDIPFYSLCAHHLVPFFGKVFIAYKPNDKVVGLSKLPRLVNHYAAKPQIQERLTTEIADKIMKELEPDGVMVIIQARHLCMEMRGVKSVGGVTITSSIRGIFLEDNIRQEVLSLLGINQSTV